MTILVAGSTSTGGLTALALNKFRRKNVACKAPRDPVQGDLIMKKIDLKLPVTVSRVSREDLLAVESINRLPE